MARFLYIAEPPKDDPEGLAAQARATTLGCGWMPAVPPEYQSVATAPCAIISGAGTTTVLPEHTTRQAVATAAAPILAAEQAANDLAATQAQNAAALQQKLAQAITANATFLAIPSPTAAQTLAQVQALTREATAVMRLLTNMVDSTSGT